MMLFQCLVMCLWDIPGFVSCRFSAIPHLVHRMFYLLATCLAYSQPVTHVKQSFVPPNNVPSTHTYCIGASAQAQSCIAYGRFIARRPLPDPRQALKVSFPMTSFHGSKNLRSQYWLFLFCVVAAQIINMFHHVRTWTPQLAEDS